MAAHELNFPPNGRIQLRDLLLCFCLQPPTDWEKFAAIEYDILSTEDDDGNNDEEDEQSTLHDTTTKLDDSPLGAIPERSEDNDDDSFWGNPHSWSRP
jgi:hypothetical protein